MLIYYTLKTKEAWYKMKTCNNIQINKHGVQVVFIKLLYKEKLIKQETYYAARAMLGPEYKKE